MWYNLYYIFYYGYEITIPLIFLFYFIIQNKKDLFKELINNSNLLICIYLLTSSFYFIYNYISAKINYGYPFKETLFSPGSSYYWIYWIPVIIGIIFAVLFLKKKIRTNLPATSLCWLFLLISNQNLIIELTNLFRDYIPSSWSYYYDLPFGLNIYTAPVFFIGLVLMLLFFTKKLKKQRSIPA